VAVENAITENDGFVGSFGANNFYLYEYGAKNRFVFIPWDKDSTFGQRRLAALPNLEANVLTRRLTADRPGARSTRTRSCARGRAT